MQMAALPNKPANSLCTLLTPHADPHSNPSPLTQPSAHQYQIHRLTPLVSLLPLPLPLADLC